MENHVISTEDVMISMRGFHMTMCINSCEKLMNVLQTIMQIPYVNIHEIITWLVQNFD
jgi:hypothetical protein